MPTRAVHLEAGVRGYVQDLPASVAGAAGSNAPQWTLLLALVLQAPVLEL